MTRFVPGQLVRKVKGYEYPGIFLAYIRKTDGTYTCAVEHRYSRGMVHLFAEGQLEEDVKGESTQIAP